MDIDIELKNIDDETKQKVIDHLESINYNEAYIMHFLKNADAENDPIDYINKKFPEALK